MISLRLEVASFGKVKLVLWSEAGDCAGREEEKGRQWRGSGGRNSVQAVEGVLYGCEEGNERDSDIIEEIIV